jgi:hypothetical protein
VDGSFAMDAVSPARVRTSDQTGGPVRIKSRAGRGIWSSAEHDSYLVKSVSS